MKHRQFKTDCFCKAKINEMTIICNDLRKVKEEIYHFGTRGETYKVNIIDKKTRIINDIYLMKYTRDGPIFQKQIYSRWKEEQAKAKTQQLIINMSL